MASTEPVPRRRLPNIVRIAKTRPRLFICLTIGVAVIAALLLLKQDMDWALLIGWDVLGALYLVLAFKLMAEADVHHMRRRARLQDEGAFAILVFTAIAALASLAAIFVLLITSPGKTRAPSEIILATVTLLISWAFTHTMFALHYAHEYYDENRGHGGGMEFPGGEREPDYWDFMYFSFVIGMCAQVSDVTVSCKPIRRTVLGHSVVSFIFNAALLALTVNIAASAITTAPQ
jgi:uncharacterized membrane protein